MIIDNGAGRARAALAGVEERRSLPAQVREAIEERILTGALREGDQIVEYQLAREMGISQTPVREALRTLERDGLIVTRPHRGTFVRRVTRGEALERYTLGMELEAFAARLAMPRLTEADYGNLNEIVDEMAAAAKLRGSGVAKPHGGAAWQSRTAAASGRGGCDADAPKDEAERVRRGHDVGGEAFVHSVEMNVAFHRYLVERAGHALLLKTWLGVNPLNWRFTTYTRLLNPDPVELAERHRSLIDAYRSGDQVMAAAAIRTHIWEVAEGVLANIPEDPAAVQGVGGGSANGHGPTPEPGPKPGHSQRRVA